MRLYRFAAVAVMAASCMAGAAASPKFYGAVGDGTTDDTIAVQAAINANQNGQLYIGDGLYRITSTVTSVGQIKIIGSGGGQGIYNGTCLSGLRIGTANLAKGLTILGAGSTVRDICIDSYGLTNSSGTGLYVGPGASSSHIEDNQVNNSCVGIDITGGPTNGITANLESVVSGNTIIDGIAGCAAIRLGVASTNGGTTDLRLTNNSVYCGTGGGIALQILDAGGLFAQGNSTGYACAIGTYIFPGAIGGVGQ